MGLKVSDALCAALCPACHYELDQGKSMTKQERRDFWNKAYIAELRGAKPIGEASLSNDVLGEEGG